jgi:hypothetical protein
MSLRLWDGEIEAPGLADHHRSEDLVALGLDRLNSMGRIDAPGALEDRVGRERHDDIALAPGEGDAAGAASPL